jgi:uncharacterized protein (DUF433 family)
VATTQNSKLIDAPAYTLREASRLTGVGFGTLHAWTHGKNPIIGLESDYWTFTNLVEAHTLRALRKTHRLRLDAVRRAVRYVEDRLPVPHPLASKVFRTDGVDLFVEKFGRLINASRDGQTAMREMIEARLRQIEYNRRGRAAKLYLDGDRRLIVIDPAVGFGRPVVAGTRVPTEMIVARFEGGETPAEIARDYDLEEEKIHQAIRMSISQHAA